MNYWPYDVGNYTLQFADDFSYTDPVGALSLSLSLEHPCVRVLVDMSVMVRNWNLHFS